MGNVANWEVASIDENGYITATRVSTENVTISNVGVTALDLSASNQLSCTGTEISFPNLPTSDPAVAGDLWNDAGTLKVSAG